MSPFSATSTVTRYTFVSYSMIRVVPSDSTELVTTTACDPAARSSSVSYDTHDAHAWTSTKGSRTPSHPASATPSTTSPTAIVVRRRIPHPLPRSVPSGDIVSPGVRNGRTQPSATAVHDTGGSVMVRVPSSTRADSFGRGATRSRSARVFFA